MSKLVEVKSLSKSFHDKMLLDNVSFSLNKGEITTLIGQNGVGKTTLARIIMKLESYDQGNIIIQKKLKIGYVPQKININSSLPLSVKSLINIIGNNILKEELIEFSDFFNYQNIENKDISELSGGELQKLMILSTLLNKYDLVILDEPTQYLDVNSQTLFYQILEKIKNQFNLTILMISHDLFTVMKNSDQVICINSHVCCSGRPTDINQNTEFQKTLSEIGLYVHHHDHKH